MFSFDAFDRKFLDLPARSDVFAAYEQRIKQLGQNGQAANAKFYETAYLSYTLKEPPITRKGLSVEKAKERKRC